MSVSIKFENISKQYRLGLVSTNTLSHDLNRWWQINVRGKEDPYLKIGEVNDRAHKGTSDYVWALKDINFEVEQGDVLGIIGKNGAGKSTLLKILSNVTSPSTGSIKARGRIASLLEVGTGFHPELTGRENIYMNGAIMGMSKAEIIRKLDEIVDFSGCERYIDTPVKRYSSGMTVRLGFAIAAHLDPEILVVDEVLAVGDAEFQKKAIGKMQDVSKGEGRTVLFVSHNMSAVETLCTKGIVLKNGSVSFSGSVEDSVQKYLDFNIINHKNIIENIEYCHPHFKIQSVTVNNSIKSEIILDDHKLNIAIEGELLSDTVMSIGAAIYDVRRNRLGLFSPGHVKGENTQFKAGHFLLESTINLPKNMTKGEYILALSIHLPNVELYLSIPEALRFHTRGLIGISGLDFEYKDNGFLILD